MGRQNDLTLQLKKQTWVNRSPRLRKAVMLILGESEDVTEGEVLLVSVEHVLIVLNIRRCRRFTRRDDA